MSSDFLFQSRRIAEGLLGEIDWERGGLARCPGADLHPRGSTGKRDCRVFIGGDKPPTIYCVHTTSCAGAVAEKNRELRRAIGRAEWEHRRGLDPTLPARRPITGEERARRRREKRQAEIARRAQAALPRLLTDYAWSLDDILASSLAYHQDPADGWRELLHLFDPADVLWIGGRRQSGKPCYDSLFRPAADWLRLASCPAGPLLCASVFRPGSYQRCRDNVLCTPFLVVESDTLSRNQIGAVFRWLATAGGVPLRGVVDTGGKSLHGWFDQPCAGTRRDDLLTALIAMGCDRGPMKEPAMSRLPSAQEPGRNLQRLLWSNPLTLPFRS